MGLISNGPIRREEIHPSIIKVFTANIIRIEDTQLRIIELCVIIWISW